jgi:single-strand DNA-binding protein
MNYNKVILAGHLTRDPELRYTQNNTAVCNFGLAVNRKYKDEENVCFVDITAWSKPAELISEYLSKGDPILLDGRLELDQWENKDGEKRSRHKITLENFQFCSKVDSVTAPETNTQEDDNVPF